MLGFFEVIRPGDEEFAQELGRVDKEVFDVEGGFVQDDVVGADLSEPGTVSILRERAGEGLYGWNLPCSSLVAYAVL